MCQESSVDVKIPFFYYFCIVKVNGFFLWQNRFVWAWKSLCTTGYSPIPLLTSVCVAVKPNLCALVSFQRNWDRCLLRWWPRMWRHQPVKLAHSRWLWVLLMPSLGSCWWRYGGFTVMDMCYRKLPLISFPSPPPTYKLPKLWAHIPVNKKIHRIISLPPRIYDPSSLSWNELIFMTF